MEDLWEKCHLCPRSCMVNRKAGEMGFCKMPAEITAARAALHMWEEPCISGKRGSGAVFFSGCTLRCIFCQNREIAEGRFGKRVETKHLKEIFLNLQRQGAVNINLITATHLLPGILPALKEAKEEGLKIPVVYNCGGYETVETLKLLEGYVDIYLPDFKYMEENLAEQFSRAKDYPFYAKKAIAEMVRQTGACEFDQEGYLTKGTLVRHLVLPGHTKNSIAVLKYLHETYGNQIYISLMSQFTPVYKQEKYVELNRKVTKREYDKVLNFAIECGIENGFFQEEDTAKESFIPLFDYEGV